MVIMETKSQLNLPPALLTKGSANGSTNRASAQTQDERLHEAMRTSGRLLEMALDRSGLTRKVACDLMGITSQRLSKWTAGMESVQDRRLMLLPPMFHEVHQRLRAHHFGLTKLRLIQMMDAIGSMDYGQAG